MGKMRGTRTMDQASTATSMVKKNKENKKRRKNMTVSPTYKMNYL